MCSVLRFTRSLFARRMIQRRFRVLQIYAPAPGPFQKLTRIDVSEGCRRCSELERGRRHIHLLSFIFAPPRSAGRRAAGGRTARTRTQTSGSVVFCRLTVLSFAVLYYHFCTNIFTRRISMFYHFRALRSAVLSFLHDSSQRRIASVLSFCTKYIHSEPAQSAIRGESRNSRQNRSREFAESCNSRRLTN